MACFLTRASTCFLLLALCGTRVCKADSHAAAGEAGEAQATTALPARAPTTTTLPTTKPTTKTAAPPKTDIAAMFTEGSNLHLNSPTGGVVFQNGRSCAAEADANKEANAKLVARVDAEAHEHNANMKANKETTAKLVARVDVRSKSMY